MERSHIELMIEGAQNILPDPYLPDTDFSENEWGAILKSGWWGNFIEIF